MNAVNQEIICNKINIDGPVTLPCDTVQLHGRGISVFPKTTVLTLLSVIIFKCARGAHKRHQGV